MSRNPVRSTTLWWPLVSTRGKKVSTCVLRAFRDDNDTAKKRNSSDVVFVLIPGNPGTPHFYELFLRNIVASSDVVTDAYCIGHTGHTRSSTSSTERLENFSYHDQSHHKVRALEEYIFKTGKRVVLCGHSIGGWILIDVLRRLDSTPQGRTSLNSIVGGLCMFPTIMDIGQTPNGKSMTPLLSSPIFRFANECIAGCLSSWCPQPLLKRFVQFFVPTMGSHDVQIVVEHLLDAEVCKQAMHMGCTEMLGLKEPDRATIGKFAEKLYFYYGPNDQWTQPVEVHMDEVKQCVYDAHKEFTVDLNDMVRLDDKDLPHACTLGEENSTLMANIFLNEFLPNMLKPITKSGMTLRRRK